MKLQTGEFNTSDLQINRKVKDRNIMVDFLISTRIPKSIQGRASEILCFLEEITEWIDEGSPVDIIYLNLQKAFDKVPRQRLLLKLKAHGIRDGIMN